MTQQEISRHILSVLVQDIDGIISRVSAMFTRRSFSLVSLVSGKTETKGINRITIVVDADEVNIEQITKQLNKLIPVLKVVRLEKETTIARALMLVKVSADASNRPQVVDAANIFRARIVDVAPDSVVIEATGNKGKLNALLDVLEPFGIRELITSGQIALSRGPKVMTPKQKNN
ncbi:acetolactate synthase small subunit [Corynebacterium sp. sy017]|uniref:acetolactate synthase small subunit n=1 Tax=unclassified Corynebacterium TaxID=2624378 RepID=UPI00118718CA|nr:MULTISPECIES: acetolactate synthase small subunit [unclassified Corynebacterium]MBP3089057.1 acetolactate synthase small subunit [Corynebacterium sp. sy017]QDZ42419.1 acetolactate synthase small subunit [Corynebacterium sp. sy039]TSD91375.1 acetolactate synthase small subunit [Corynebacterium sp. SY003]